MLNKKPLKFTVDYYYVTQGGKSRTKMTTSIHNISGAQSETAVLAYLRQKHPKASEIIIMSLEWNY